MGLVDSWREQLESMKAAVECTDGGKAVDYAQIERKASERCRKSEREAHRAILSALDIDVPTIVIGGLRYNRVGDCCPTHARASSRSRIWSARLRWPSTKTSKTS